ncbi:MAG: hypothetical protein LBR44_12400 [Clostridiales Family XIII bacterium]|jgi:hypothetical protein|nr:hypothetical protein [Clostridiales Family XIII bacterium]
MNNDPIEKDVIYPPTAEQIQELRTHNVGMAVRLAAKLGRPLEDWEYEMFRKERQQKIYSIVELPNQRFGIA